MDMAERFLCTTFSGAPEDAYILLWTLPDRRSRFFPSVALAEAAAYAVERSADSDVYVGCTLRARDHGPHARGEATEAHGIIGLWADIDVMKPATAKTYFPTRAAADAFLD